MTDILRAEENVLNKIQENFPDDSTQTAAPASVYRKIYFRGLDQEHMKSMAASHVTSCTEFVQVSCRHMGTREKRSFLYNGRDEHEIMGWMNEKMKKSDSKGCILASPTTVYIGIVFSSI